MMYDYFSGDSMFHLELATHIDRVFDLKDASVFIQGGGGGQELEVIMDEGNFTFNIQSAYEQKKNRGKLDTVKKGDEVAMTVSWTGRYSYITGDGSDVTIIEALENERFDGADWISLGWDSSDDREGHECDPYCVNLVVDYDPSASCNALAGNPLENQVFKYFRAENINVDTKAGTIAIDGFCNVRKPEGTRSA